MQLTITMNYDNVRTMKRYNLVLGLIVIIGHR